MVVRTSPRDGSTVKRSVMGSKGIFEEKKRFLETTNEVNVQLLNFMKKKQEEIEKDKFRNRYGKGKTKPALSSFKVNEMAVKNIINMPGLKTSLKK